MPGEGLTPDLINELYADTNGNGVLDEGDILLTSTTTANGGLYLFDNLPPGNYRLSRSLALRGHGVFIKEVRQDGKVLASDEVVVFRTVLEVRVWFFIALRNQKESECFQYQDSERRNF